MLPLAKTFVINRRQDKIRKKHIQKAAQKISLPLTFISAIEGAAIKDFTPYTTFWGKYFLPPSLLGCGLSHRKVWKKIITANLPNALILEDDAFFSSKFRSRLLRALAEAPTDYDVIFLGRTGANPDGTTLFSQIANAILPHCFPPDSHYSAHLIRPGFVCGAFGYLVSYRGAQKLLRLIPRIKCHIDLQMSQNFSQLNVFTLRKSIIYTGKEPSTLGTKTPLTLNKIFSKFKIRDFSLDWFLSEEWFYIAHIHLRTWNLILFFFSFIMSRFFGIIPLILLILFLLLDLQKLPMDNPGEAKKEYFTTFGDIISVGVGCL